MGDALPRALLVHRLLPKPFTHRDLRAFPAPLLGATIEDIAAGKMTYVGLVVVLGAVGGGLPRGGGACTPTAKTPACTLGVACGRHETS